METTKHKCKVLVSCASAKHSLLAGSEVELDHATFLDFESAGYVEAIEEATPVKATATVQKEEMVVAAKKKRNRKK